MKRQRDGEARKAPKARRLLWAAFAFVVFIAVLFIGRGLLFSPASDGAADPGDELEIDVRPRLTATRVVGRRQGERQFELDAGFIGDDEEWVLLEQIQNGLLYRDGAVFVAFQADAGRWHRSSNNLVLTGNVELLYDERVNIRTEQLEWRAATELVIAPGPVHMTIDGDVVTAASMEADLDAERMRLEGDVRITRESGDRVTMATVVYWLADDRLEGFGQGQLVFGAQDDINR